MKGRGFIVHSALTSTLDGLAGEARTAVIGAAYAQVRGLTDYRLPKKFAMFEFLVAGIVAEAKEICERPSRAEKPRPAGKTGAQRTAEYRARLARKGAECDESDASDGVTNVTSVTNVTKTPSNGGGCDGCDGCDDVTNVTDCDEQVSKEVSKEVSKSGTRVTVEDVRIAAHNLGVPKEFAIGYFLPEMQKLGWQARGTAGRMFDVTRRNLASVLRGWWAQEKRKTPPRPSGEEPAPSVAPSITDGELIS